MELKVCKNCRRLFKYIYGPELCQDCAKLMTKEGTKQNVTESAPDKKATLRQEVRDDEDKFFQVRDYIMAHPKATIVQISEENGITPFKLFDWIREDRLEFSDDSQYAWFECSKCGAKIKSGKVCNNCKIR